MTRASKFRGEELCIFSLLLMCWAGIAVDAVSSRNLLATTTQIGSCLRPAGAKVVFPSEPEYEAARGHVFNHRFLYKPATFIFVSSVAQVQNAVKCAVKLKLGIAPRGGGHSYEDYSLGGRDGVLVVDMGGLNTTILDKNTELATVGAGVRLGPMKLALWEQGKRTIPSGTCPSVGVAGHSLGGGWGFVSRKFGITADSIVAAQVVTAKGSVVTTSSKSNSDLLFALKGAGANSFGIVTQFTFKTYDVSQKVTSFRYDYDQNLQANLTRAFQCWGITAPADVSASVVHDPSGTNEISGVYLGPKSNIRNVMNTFLSSLPGPTSVKEVEVDYITTVLTDAGFAAADPLSSLNLENYNYPTATFKSKSIFAGKNGFSEAGIKAYVEALQVGPASSYMIFDLYGPTSAINQIPSDASAWVHRDTLFSIQMFTYWQEQPSEAAADIKWIDGLWRKVRPFSSRQAYQNYIDSDTPLSAYYGSNLAKLKTIKKKWDPMNVFNFQKSIPVN